MISVSGMFAVTFSIAFAYVADCTEESERSTAYGLVNILVRLSQHKNKMRRDNVLYCWQWSTSISTGITIKVSL